MVTVSVGLRNFEPTAPTSWDRLTDMAQAAEESGIDRVVVSDHVAFGEDLDAYARPELGGRVGGRQPTGSDGHWLEPLIVLAHVAATTSRVRLATGILLAALRRPVVLAKQAATLDVLSGGRLDLGVGVGWQREEYEAAGLAFEDRGSLLDHTLEVCHALWGQSAASHTSDRLTFDRIHQMPKPVNPDGVPIWVSGTANRRVVRRVAAYGAGWIPWGDDAADPAAGIDKIRAAMVEAGRNPANLGVSVPLPAIDLSGTTSGLDAALTATRRLTAAGATDLRLNLVEPPDTLLSLVDAIRTAADARAEDP